MIRTTLLAATDRQAQPWKNGGGTTTSIAVSPPGAGFDDFDWRLSMASVASTGPFSRFDGTDRILAVIEGRLSLAFEEGARVVALSPESTPHAFAGDDAVVGAPIGGPVVDLNLMIRHGRWTGAMEKVATPVSIKLASDDAIILFTREGQLHRPGEAIALRSLDALRIEGGSGMILNLESDGTVYVITLLQSEGA